MEISFDPAKREQTLRERGLDFMDAPAVLAGVRIEQEDDRFDYGEVRIMTVGYLGNRMDVVIWTARGVVRHIISMRKANAREQEKYKGRLGRSG
jgi:uncharacterized DUF497 family protein